MDAGPYTQFVQSAMPTTSDSEFMARAIAALLGAGFGAVLGWTLSFFSPIVLVWIRGPKLECEPIAEETPTTASGIRHWYASVNVTNVKGRIARECRVFLTRIEELQSNGASIVIFDRTIQCVWEYDAERDSFDIPFGASPSCNFVVVVDGKPGFEPQFRKSDGKKFIAVPYQHLFARNGRYRFTGVVTADEIEAVPFSAQVVVTGTWPPCLSK